MPFDRRKVHSTWTVFLFIYCYCAFDDLFNKIAVAPTMIINRTAPNNPIYFTALPNTIPTAKKSVSENVVAAPPNSPKNGKNNNGKTLLGYHLERRQQQHL